MEPRRFTSGALRRDPTTRGNPSAPGLPGNGERTLTHSERKWLTEQMASQRKRPANPARSGDVEPTRPPDVVPHTSAERGPSPGKPADVSERKQPTARRPSPPASDSFWSFG